MLNSVASIPAAAAVLGSEFMQRSFFVFRTPVICSWVAIAASSSTQLHVQSSMHACRRPECCATLTGLLYGISHSVFGEAEPYSWLLGMCLRWVLSGMATRVVVLRRRRRGRLDNASSYVVVTTVCTRPTWADLGAISVEATSVGVF